MDLPALLGRPRLPTLLGAGGAAILVGCSSHESQSSGGSASPSTAS